MGTSLRWAGCTGDSSLMSNSSKGLKFILMLMLIQATSEYLDVNICLKCFNHFGNKINKNMYYLMLFSPLRCYNYWFWVPLVAPLIGALVGTFLYQILISWHLPDPKHPERVSHVSTITTAVTQPEPAQDKGLKLAHICCNTENKQSSSQRQPGTLM